MDLHNRAVHRRVVTSNVFGEKMKKLVPTWEFSITGLILALVLTSVFMTSFSFFTVGVQNVSNITGNNSLENYSITGKIVNLSKDINQTLGEIKPEAGLLDLIGAFFGSATTALKSAAARFGLFNELTSQASKDIPGFFFFKTSLQTIVLVVIIVGIMLSAYLKWKV